MMNLTPILALCVLFLLYGSVSAQLYLATAGVDSERIRTLSPTAVEKICPDDFPSGFSVECVTGVSGRASIRVNGGWVRTEQREPFFVGGDVRGVPRPWIDYPSTAVVDCLPNARRTGALTTTIEFKCDGSSPLPIPSIISSPSFSPSPSPLMTVLSIPSMTSSPSVSPNEPLSAPDRGSNSSVGRPSMPPFPPTTSMGGCITIDARNDLLNKTLSEGWAVDDDHEGLTFRKDDDRETITAKDVAPLYYPVVSTANSRFAIVVDMTTRMTAEHNDIWVFFSENIQAMRKGVADLKMGWVKGYHNENGRANKTFTVDFDPHTLSTGEVLKTGNPYLLGIGGRSSKVTVHKIYMFPCEGLGCQRGKLWDATLATCLA